MYKNSNFKTFILIFGISFSSIFAHTEPVVLLDQDTSSKNISSLIEYRYRDQKFAGCSPNHIDGLEDLEWHSISADVLRVKRTSFGNWLRFSVQNSEPTIQNRILLLGWLNVPDTQLCFFDKNGKFVSVKSGYSNPTTDEKILTTLPHFKIDLQPNENRIFYLFVLSNEDINYRIRIMGLEEFELHKRLKFITSYSIVGIIGFAVLYSFFGYYRFKNSTFIFFPLYVFSVILTFYFLHGRTFAEVFGNTNNLFRHSYFLFLGTSYVFLFLYLFAIDKANQKKVYRSVFFWIAGAFGILYSLIPLLQSWYDHRILLLVATVGLSFSILFEFIINSSVPILQSDYFTQHLGPYFGFGYI